PMSADVDDSCPTRLLYKPDDLPAYPEDAEKGDDRRPDHRMRPERDAADGRRGVGQLGERAHDLVQFARLDDLAGRDAGQLLEDLGPRRASRTLGGGALHVEGGFEGRAGLLAEER